MTKYLIFYNMPGDVEKSRNIPSGSRGADCLASWPTGSVDLISLQDGKVNRAPQIL